MKEYILTGEITISVYTRVEAETLKEAIEIASERDVEKSEWNSHRQSSYCWVNDEYDGDIVNVKEEE